MLILSPLAVAKKGGHYDRESYESVLVDAYCCSAGQ